jgi:hypothetical protein
MYSNQISYSVLRPVVALPDLRAIRCYAAVLVWMLPSIAVAAGLVRLSDGKREYEGKVVALSRTQCSLIDRQGQLVQLRVGDLKEFENVASRFQSQPLNEFRDDLRQEFVGDYEVAGTTHYLVCAPRGRGKRYGDVFESIYRDVEHFYRVNGFEIQSPDVPMVAVVFGSQKEFFAYCVKDHVPPSPGLMGYYSLRTNRVALYDDEHLLSSVVPTNDASLLVSPTAVAASAGISGETTNTIIHETTHQVGYNIGIHSRLGGTPLWVVEGLATVLEPDGMRHRTGHSQMEDRINEERQNWFAQQHRPDREMGSLGQLIASDAYFQKHTLDSYSESWAFSYFLLDNSSRRRSLVDYLQKISQRDATKQYTAKERLADFQNSFGDISRLEIEFIRFMDRL